MQFGPLSNRQAVDKRFQQLRNQSRQQLLAQIYAKNNPQTATSVQQDLSNAFAAILQVTHFDQHHSVARQIAQIFSIDLQRVGKMDRKQREKYVNEKIQGQLQDSLKVIDKMAEDQMWKCANTAHPQFKNKQCEWLGIKTQYTHLRPIFQQILLEKVKLFDNQLSRLTDVPANIPYDAFKTVKNNMNTQQTLQTQARGSSVMLNRSKTATINYNSSNINKNISATLKSHRSTTLNNSKTATITHVKTNSWVGTNISSPVLNKHKQVQSAIQSQFCDVQIRDKSQFLLSRWQQSQQVQFAAKMGEFRSNLKINQVPVLYQFVKKYTKTVKARDNIYRKWEQRQHLGITPQQLRYLCATSLFLNQTLAPSQKQRVKNNLKAAGSRLISKLQGNIAQKIIDTYHQLTKKISDLRAKYYQQLSKMRKEVRKQASLERAEHAKKQHSNSVFLKYRQMFKNIIEGQRMSLKLNPNKMKWVTLFITNLKKAIGKNKKRAKTKSQVALKRLCEPQNKVLSKIKAKYPSSKVIKREDQYSHRLKYRTYIPSQRFHYGKLQQTISQLNNMKYKCNHDSSLKKQLSGGPNEAPKQIIVDLTKQKIYLSKPSLVKYVVIIQATWRVIYYRKRYLQMRQQARQKHALNFKQQLESLRRIYPLGKGIDLKGVQNRLRRVNMKINNILKPYIRIPRKPINLYTFFSSNRLSMVQMKNKYTRNGCIRLAQFYRMIEKNQYPLLKKSGIVVTATQINNPAMQRNANAIWWAVFHSNLQLVAKLLQGGGDACSKDQDGNSCLHMAIRNGDMQIVFMLLDFGGDLNAKNNKKMSPLFFASSKMLKLLGMEEGAVAGQRDNNSLFYRRTMDDWQEVYGQHHY